MKPTFLILLTILLVACATTAPSQKAQTIQEADERIVENCEYLGEVYETAEWSLALTRKGQVEYCRNRVKEKAADLGASHILITKIGGMGWLPYITGKAYRCD